MLSRNKHGSLSPLLRKLFFLSLLHPRLSSNPSSNSTYQIHPSTNSTNQWNFPYFRYIHNDPSSKSIQTLNSNAVSIISLLSNKTHQETSINELLKPFKDKLSSGLVKEVLMSYRQLGRIRTLEFFTWAGIQMGFMFDDSVVEYMADFLGRRKLFDDLKCLLVTVLDHKGKVSCRAFSICIRFLGRQGRVREALCLFQEMEPEFKCKPDNLVCNNMLYVLCKKEVSIDLIDVALEIFRKIESPDTYSYSNILVGLCKFGRSEDALDFFGEMYKARLVPTRSAVNILIGDLCVMSSKEGAVEKVRVNSLRRPFTILVPNVSSKSGAIQPAIRVFWAVHDRGLLPSGFVINQLILELCRLGNMEEAVEVLKVVEERKLACLLESYSIAIKGLCEHRLVDEACNCFGRMLSQGLKPKVVVYNSVIGMLSKLGNLDGATKAFEIMNKNSCLPDNVTYRTLVHAYCEGQNWEAAYELLMEMLGLGWSPHYHTYSLVERLLKENGRADLLVKLERKLETQTLHKHCKESQLEAAYEKLKSMLEKGIYPPPYVRDAFERAFQAAGKWNIARELMERMDEDCKHDPSELCNS